MPFWYPGEGSDNDPAWWSALEQVALLTQRSPALPTIAACEFMFMGAVDRRKRGRIWLYKHIWTRKYLNLDHAGRAYRYVEPRNRARGNPRCSSRSTQDRLVSRMCYDCRMTEVASRALRNNTRALLERVEAGEAVTITVDGRPVAVLQPVGRRPGWIARDEFARSILQRQADAALRAELAELAPDDTDSLPTL